MQIVLDSMKHDGRTRYNNHVCSPNYYVKKQEAQGCLRVGVFAQCDVQQGEELTIDYECEMSDKRLITKYYCL